MALRERVALASAEPRIPGRKAARAQARSQLEKREPVAFLAPGLSARTRGGFGILAPAKRTEPVGSSLPIPLPILAGLPAEILAAKSVQSDCQSQVPFVGV